MKRIADRRTHDSAVAADWSRHCGDVACVEKVVGMRRRPPEGIYLRVRCVAAKAPCGSPEQHASSRIGCLDASGASAFSMRSFPRKLSASGRF